MAAAACTSVALPSTVSQPAGRWSAAVVLLLVDPLRVACRAAAAAGVGLDAHRTLPFQSEPQCSNAGFLQWVSAFKRFLERLRRVFGFPCYYCR